MTDYKVGLDETVPLAEAVEAKKPRYPEREPGLRRALKLIEYLRDTCTGNGTYTHPNQVAIAVLDQLKNSIEVEIENGGPLTTPVE